MRQKIMTITAADFDWSYTKGSGKGGQKRNKTSSAVHCTHRDSGAHGYAEDSRSQLQNKQKAFMRCVSTDVFRKWLRREQLRRLGILDDIERKVEYEMNHNIRVEVQEGGVWVEERNHQ